MTINEIINFLDFEIIGIGKYWRIYKYKNYDIIISDKNIYIKDFNEYNGSYIKIDFFLKILQPDIREKKLNKLLR